MVLDYKNHYFHMSNTPYFYNILIINNFPNFARIAVFRPKGQLLTAEAILAR